MAACEVRKKESIVRQYRLSLTCVALLAGCAVIGDFRPVRAGQTYTVNNGTFNAGDDNPGTQAHPLKTIQAAADRAQPSDTPLVRAGIYREEMVPPRGGSAPDRPITYPAAPGEKVSNGGLFLEVNFGPLILDNNVITRSNVVVESDGCIITHNLFTDCRLHFMASSQWIVPYYAPHSTIRTGTSGVSLRHNRILNNILIGGDEFTRDKLIRNNADVTGRDAHGEPGRTAAGHRIRLFRRADRSPARPARAVPTDRSRRKPLEAVAERPRQKG